MWRRRFCVGDSREDKRDNPERSVKGDREQAGVAESELMMVSVLDQYDSVDGHKRIYGAYIIYGSDSCNYISQFISMEPEHPTVCQILELTPVSNQHYSLDV